MSLNPTSSGGQPFPLSQKVILEKRTEEGILDLSDPQPPFKVRNKDMIFNDVYTLYFRENPDSYRGSWEALRAWLDSKNWVVRTKTW